MYFITLKRLNVFYDARKVYAEATIVFPLLVAQTFAKDGPAPGLPHAPPPHFLASAVDIFLPTPITTKCHTGGDRLASNTDCQTRNPPETRNPEP